MDGNDIKEIIRKSNDKEVQEFFRTIESELESIEKNYPEKIKNGIRCGTMIVCGVGVSVMLNDNAPLGQHNLVQTLYEPHSNHRVHNFTLFIGTGKKK